MRRINWSIAAVIAMFSLAAPDAPAQSHAGAYMFTGSGEGARLGVMLQDVTARLKDRKKLGVDVGAYVAEVVEDSPAEKSGIKEGDVIVSFDGKTIRDADDLTRAVSKAGSDEAVSVALSRGGEQKTLSVKLRKQSRTRSYSYSFGGHGPVVLPPAPPRAPRGFRFNFMASQRVEGMELQKLSTQLAEYFEVPGGRGLLVTSVEKQSASADAGLKAGDVIVKVNASSVRDGEALREELHDGELGSAKIDILRHGKAQIVTLKVEEREERDEDAEIESDDDEDASLDLEVPMLLQTDRASSRQSLSQANRDFLHDLHETLSEMQIRIREKMLRLQERITDNVLNM